MSKKMKTQRPKPVSDAETQPPAGSAPEAENKAAAEAPPEAADHSRHRSRLRAKAGGRPERLNDRQLMELILFEAIPRIDTAGIADALLEALNGPAGLLASPEPLAPLAGSFGENTQLFLCSFSAVCRRYMRRAHTAVRRRRTFHELQGLFVRNFKNCGENTVAAVTLNASLRPQRYAAFSAKGNCGARVSRFFMQAAEDGEASLAVLGFYHENGFLAPTPKETRMVVELWDLCRRSGFRLVEAVIVSPDGSACISDNPLFPQGMFPE